MIPDSLFILVPLVLFATVLAFVMGRQHCKLYRVWPQSAHAAIIGGNAVLIDIRGAHAWRGGVAVQASLLPMSDLRGRRTYWRRFLAQHRDKRLFVYGNSDWQSARATAMLRREGYNAMHLGSYAAWTGASLPVEVPYFFINEPPVRKLARSGT